MDDTTVPIPCPVCNDCDHDLRSGVLELMTNIMDNFKASSEKLLDGIEADGTGAPEFIEALSEFAVVKHQITAVMETIPELAILKAAHA